jgi:mRNA-degrading endonuclease YafQ of YafQ-DinJ toxin-antitoxin module
MKIVFSNSFKQSTKKLMRKQIAFLEDIIDELVKNPEIGELKKGDLSGIRVHKFNCQNHHMLLAYQYFGNELVLLYLNTHKNFYRDLKKRL